MLSTTLLPLFLLLSPNKRLQSARALSQSLSSTRFSSRRGREFVSFVSYQGQTSRYRVGNTEDKSLTHTVDPGNLLSLHPALSQSLPGQLLQSLSKKNFKVAAEGGRDQKEELKGHAIDSGIYYQLGVVSG